MLRTGGLRALACGVAGVMLLLAGACTMTQTRQSTSVIDFLYPNTKEPVAEQGIPVLNLPLRVGVAFVPEAGVRQEGTSLMRDLVKVDSLSQARKRQLLEVVAQHFRELDFVRAIEVIPTAYLRPQGGFQNLDQLRTMYGIDVIALVSYDQTQFTEEGLSSLAYWTVVGAYVVRGEKNSTHTMVDAVVLDIPSRKMLFRAPGLSFVQGSATPANLAEQLRLDAERGFEEAVVEMIANLDQELVVFQDRVRSNPEEYRVVHSPGHSGGGGAAGPAELLLLLALAGVRVMRRS